MLLANYAQHNRNTGKDLGQAFRNPHAFLKATAMNRFYMGDHVVTGQTNKSGWGGGYSGETAWYPPMKAGGMGGVARIALSTYGAMALGGGMEGSSSISLSVPSADLKLIVGLEGSSSITLSSSASLSGSVTLEGSSSISLSVAPAQLSALVGLQGSASITLSSSADLKGISYLEGHITPFADLSPENLAAAVWNAVLTDYPTAGTAGNTLALAGSGGVDYNALATAVWNHTTRSLTISGLSSADAEKLLHIWRLLGLDPSNPVTTTTTEITATDIDIAVSGNGETSTTLTRS